MKQDSVVDERGFFFAVFQSDASKDRVKVWFDGSEDYDYFSHEEFVSMAEDVEYAMRRALRDYSYFLWDVRAKRISRLRFQQTPDQIRKLLVEHAPAPSDTAPDSIPERYYNTEANVSVSSASINVK